MGCLRCAARFDDLPSPVVERTKLVLLDCIGAIAAGMQEPEMRALFSGCRDLGGQQRAAPAIGRAAHESAAREPAQRHRGDDAGTRRGQPVCPRPPGYPCGSVALAAAERIGALRPDLLLAVALGYEIGSRIGIASKLRDHASARHLGNRRRRVGGREAGGASDDEIIETINIASSSGSRPAGARCWKAEPSAIPTRGSNQLGLMAWELQVRLRR